MISPVVDDPKKNLFSNESNVKRKGCLIKKLFFTLQIASQQNQLYVFQSADKRIILRFIYPAKRFWSIAQETFYYIVRLIIIGSTKRLII